jgi:hypothetical protein
MTMSTHCWCSIWSASVPVVAVTTSYPSSFSRKLRIFTREGSSSTINIFIEPAEPPFVLPFTTFCIGLVSV